MRTYVTWAIAASLLTSPSFLQAGENRAAVSEKVTLRNVQLQANGAIVGQLLTDTGLAIAGTEVKVHDQKAPTQIFRKTKTDAQGRFVVRGLKTGTVVLSVGDDSYACRVWKEGTAPPKSLNSVAVVVESDVVRGQNGRFGLRNPFQRLQTLSTSQKVGLGVVVAAAIALPVVLDDEDDDVEVEAS